MQLAMSSNLTSSHVGQLMMIVWQGLELTDQCLHGVPERNYTLTVLEPFAWGKCFYQDLTAGINGCVGGAGVFCQITFTLTRTSTSSSATLAQLWT